jgi:hypothetical protein
LICTGGLRQTQLLRDLRNVLNCLTATSTGPLGMALT